MKRIFSHNQLPHVGFLRMGLLLGLGLLILGCSSQAERLESEPDFTGFITGYQSSEEGSIQGVLLVESHADKQVDKYHVTVTQNTGIFEKDGAEFHSQSFEIFAEKQWVQIWFDGPVKESFPMQVDAGQVVIFQPGDPDLSSAEGDMGTLAGQASIGPLSPVAQQGVPEPTPMPEMYAGRMVVIFDEAGQNEIDRVEIGPDGSYQIDLPAGSYMVDINKMGIGFSKDLPQVIQISGQQVTRLDFSIDTGIR